MPIYLVDTNFFIEAHRKTYPFDVVPGFWAKVQQLAQRNVIASCDKVYDEICGGKDQLASWISSSLPATFFRNSNSVLSEYRTIINWAKASKHYNSNAIAEFLAADEADAWLIAHALNGAKNPIVLVTHEKSDPNNKKRIKIPDVCNNYSLAFVNTIEMFRALNETF